MALTEIFGNHLSGIGLIGVVLSSVVPIWAFSDAFSRPVQGPPAERL